MDMDEMNDMEEMDQMGMDYGMEMDDEYQDGYPQEGQMMEEGMGDYGDEEESINFDGDPEYAHLPPLDKMRKIRRTIIQTINNMREAHNAPSIYVDILGNRAASEYAQYLLSNPEDEEKAKEICTNNHITAVVHPLVGFAILEEDEDHQPSLNDCLMDAHGLLLELEHEVGILTDSKNTHIGIGFAYNKEVVKVVEFVSERPIMVNQVNESEDGGVEARGVVLNKEIGIYAARVAAVSKMGKDVKVVGPANIQFDKASGNFIINVPGPLEDLFYSGSDPKLIQFYIRSKAVDKIPYGQESSERINVAHLEAQCMTLPLEYMPDPRTIIEDEADIKREAKDRELRMRKAEEENMIKQAEKVARQAEKEKLKHALIEARGEMGADSQGDDSGASQSKKSRQRTPGHEGSGASGQGGSEDDDGDDMDDSQMDDDDSDGEGDSDEMAELPSQQEMKKDLLQAIEEELREQDQLRRENEELQKSIISMDPNFEQYDKQPDVQMNEHKYLNTLANVHQVRINLKETQDRYNKMASELQAKLNEKQAKCHEIEQQFKELKRSVASNAMFSRTGKAIPPKTRNEWEESESLKDQEVHQYRLQNIALRNKLANKEKVLKKKEQLADGLHLIDFEQLKIENQTLNEKIEERNEELHKLRKKITQTVVILSHTREKLQYVQQQNVDEKEKLQGLNDQLNTEKNEQSKLKKQREKLQQINQRLKQQTGIVNKKELKEDFERRKNEIQGLQEKIKKLESKHGQLTSIIEQATEIQMKKMT